MNRGEGKGTRNGVSSAAGRRGRETRDVHLSRAPPAPGTPSHPTGIDHVFLLPAASYRACVHFTRSYPLPRIRARTRTRASTIPRRVSPPSPESTPIHSTLPFRSPLGERGAKLSATLRSGIELRKIPPRKRLRSNHRRLDLSAKRSRFSRNFRCIRWGDF